MFKMIIETHQKNAFSRVIELEKLGPEFNPICPIPTVGFFLLHQYSINSYKEKHIKESIKK